MKIHSNSNADLLSQLVCQKATMLKILRFEGMFGKRKLTDLALTPLRSMVSKELLTEFTCKQVDMTDK